MYANVCMPHLYIFKQKKNNVLKRNLSLHHKTKLDKLKTI